MSLIFKKLSAVLVVVLLTTSPLVAQNRRPAPQRRQPAPVVESPPTFDTLLGENTYRIYFEVRQAGQLVRSPAVTDVLEPFMKLARPPKEFRSVVKWLNDHAETLAGSRLFVATSPSKQSLPSAITAVEFASPEEAKKFAAELRAFVPKLLPTPAPTPSPSPVQPGAPPAFTPRATDPVEVRPEPPSFHTNQIGSLVLFSDRSFSPRDLRGRGEKLLMEHPDFMAARNRFASESVFFYVNIASFEKQDAARRAKYEESDRERLGK